MPSTYAHYRMGQEVKEKSRGEERRIIAAHSELYLIGLHGPDIFFYYKPLRIHPVNQIGYGTHSRAGAEFFERAAQVIGKHKDTEEREEYLAYVYGVICHFALDVTCHGYIDRRIEESGITHTEIEVEFDRELMLMDGLDPLRQELTGHIVPSLENAKVIREFYPAATVEQVQESLESMIFHNHLLITPSKGKRWLVCALLKATGNYKEMHGLMVNYEKNPDCEMSTKNLSGLYQNAKELAIRLILEYGDYLENKKPLDEIYRYTFGTKEPEKEEKAG